MSAKITEYEQRLERLQNELDEDLMEGTPLYCGIFRNDFWISDLDLDSSNLKSEPRIKD